MEVVKETDEYKVIKKKNGRFGVKRKNKWVNGDEKVAILVKEGFLKVPVPKPKAEEPAAEEEPAEGASE